MKLDQWFASSKLCSDCGHKMPDMPLHQRQWVCPACGVGPRHQRGHKHSTARNIGIKSGGARRFCPWRPV
ncbi:zinc ribbon domain-containing protein [Aeromonas caviae]